VHGDSRIGRPSPEGLRVLQQAIGPADRIVVFDLGSNDDIAQPRVLASDLAGARRATGDRCLIVATLNRPPYNGVPIDGLNQAVLAFASAEPNVQLVDWNAIAQSEPGVLGPDGVHPTPQGYALRAQLFAQAVAACTQAPADESDSLAPPPAAPNAKKKRPKRRIKVPGIESSGISFTEPVRVRGLQAQLLLPNTKPPYAAIAMLGGSQAEAEFLAAHGIATLTYRERGSADDARAAVALLAGRDDIRHGGIGLWAFGAASARAAEVAAGNRDVAALVAMSPSALPEAEQRDWRARRRADAPAVTTWLRIRSDDADPARAWGRVAQPVLAIWGTRDDRLPVRASAEALKRGLAAGANRDRTFRWFGATHGGAVAYKDGQPVFAPGLLEETARWLGLRLGEQRAKPVIHDDLPPANPGPKAEDVADASALYSLPVQAIWLLAPALMLVAAPIRARRVGVHMPPRASEPGPASAQPPVSALPPEYTRIPVASLGAGIACAACIVIGIALALRSGGGEVASIAGTPWPFALAFVFAAGLGASAVAALRRSAALAFAGATIWLALALFWLL
jgi:hypothetical protein